MADNIVGSNATPSGSSQVPDTSIEQFTKEGFTTLMEAIKNSNALPSGRDWNFHNMSDSFKKIMTDEGNTVLQLMNKLMRCNDIESNIRNRVLDQKMELVIEANDSILERVANNIDDLNGLRKTVFAPIEIQTVSAEIPINGSWNRFQSATIAVNSNLPQSDDKRCIKLITAKNIVRPQKFFKDKIDNDNARPWCPRITDKPNSLKPLALFLEEYEDRQEFSHPYEAELDRFQPTPEQLQPQKPVTPKPLSETPLEEIDTPEQLTELVETLRQHKEFAVDVEHHSYRSFMGITCLLQISTTDKDYLIDTLKLRDKLHVLNEVFTKNNIVKIFHGADKDVEWLQRDLSIYIVNMFDTHQAAKALQYTSLSLAFLMKKFCNVLPNKQFQLADWRIRPLPDELKMYAREDTHYLIYIYHMLKKELLMKKNGADNLLRATIERSTEICKKRYFKPILLDDSHLDIYRKCKKLFNNRQLYALREIYAWRDNLAREEDESLGYVLPNHMILQISEALPREMQGILACCNPIPPLVRSHLLELHQIVLKARDQPLEKAILKDTTGRGVLKKMSKVNVDGALHCPHDLSKANEFRDDLPTLLNDVRLQTDCRSIGDVKLAIEKISSYGIFDDGESADALDERETFKKMHGFAYFSPFERYKLVKPFVAAEEEAGAVEEVKEQEVQQQTSEKTDEDRISSIRDHFVQLSKRFSEELQVQKQEEEREQERVEREQSLLEMGGSRKRKREDYSSANNWFDDSATTGQYGETSDRSNQNWFEDPAPVIHYGEARGQNNQNWYDGPAPVRHYGQTRGRNNRNRGEKRKFDHLESNNEDGESNTKKKKRNFSRRQRQKQIAENHKNQEVKQENQQYDNPQHEDVKQELQYQNQEQQQKVRQRQKNKARAKANQNQQKNNEAVGFQQAQNQKSNQGKKKGRKQNQNQSFVPYDYASVDFRQFQGGAGSAGGSTNFKFKYKPKNRNKKFNKGAKSSTFSNPHPGSGGNKERQF